MPKENEGIMPAGAPLPEEEEVIIEEELPEGPPPEEEPEPKMYAGKFKSPEDLESGYVGLEEKVGSQGRELGTVKKQNELLMQQLESIQKSQTKETQPEPDEDLDAQIAAIARQVEEGELSIAESLVKTAVLSSKKATSEAVRGVKEMQQRETIQKSQQAFRDENAEFFELQKSGALDAYKAKYPGLHDDFSAYYAYKADSMANATQAAVEAAKAEAFEAGKKTMAKVAAGDERTTKVLQKPGGTQSKIGRPTKGAYTQKDLRNSGLEALRKARGG